jgi:hypothetical protein
MERDRAEAAEFLNTMTLEGNYLNRLEGISGANPPNPPF